VRRVNDMSDDTNKPLEENQDIVADQAPADVDQRYAPVPAKGRSQAILVYAGIVCLIVGAVAGWQVSKRKQTLISVVRFFQSDPQNREKYPQALNEWVGALRGKGGPYCKAIADLITSEQVPDLLREKNIRNFDDMLNAVGEGGELASVCEGEMTNQLNYAAWALALGGIGLIGLDILRDRQAKAARKRTTG